jgi:hypothetical protein
MHKPKHKKMEFDQERFDQDYEQMQRDVVDEEWEDM